MQYDVVVIGAGIVGLSFAYTFKKKDPAAKLLVLEKETQPAFHQTGHNSGVIHSGIYYKPGSLKARNCLRGYELLLRFCEENNVPHEICGKIITATRESELPFLKQLFERGKQNGLDGLEMLSPGQVREREPHVAALKGLFVPQTGIIDYRSVAEKLSGILQEYDVEVRLGEKVIQMAKTNAGLGIITGKGSYQARRVVNCSGLQSDRVARILKKKLDVRIIPFRGEYYTLNESRRSLVKNLVYPVPDPAFPFLGVHFTRMINGQVEAGPNAVLALKREGYGKSDFCIGDTVDTLLWPGFWKLAAKYWREGAAEMYRSFSKDAFVKALQRLVPEIGPEDLVAGGAGVRAQACDRNGNLLDDFLIIDENGVINVCNAPSPAATASLAIGEHICRYVDGHIGL